MIVHSKPSQRGSWDPHGVVGFYVGPVMDHYRCFRCYIPTTRAERISDTITFVSYHVPIPKISRADLIHRALQKIEKLTMTPPPKVTAIMEQTDTTDIINELAKIFQPTLEKLRSEPSTMELQNYFKKIIPNKYNLPSPINMLTVPSTSRQHTVLSMRVGETLNAISEIPHDNSPNKNIISSTYPRKPWYPVVNHIYDESGRGETLDSLRASIHGNVWEEAFSNEWGRLAQGNKQGVAYTDTITFIKYTDVPTNKAATYASFVCDHCLLKTEKWRVRIFVGGDRLTYSHDTGSPATSLPETKI